jgi:hypothetical protein
MVGSGGNMKSTLLCGICSEHGDLDFEGKRLALDMLGITVYLDGENVEVTGTIDPGIVLTPSSLSFPLSDQLMLSSSR